MLKYLQLMRLHKPVGIWLLWAPTAWALWIANSGHPSAKYICLFFLGVVLMRSAGCVANDIADRNFDSKVERTKTRPLAAGALSVDAALGLLVILLFFSLLVLLALPASCFIWALIALAITLIYPLFKRFFQCPQLILGLAFSMSIPMVYRASSLNFDSNFALLWFINFLWIIAYDTEYAMADRSDDLQIGINSSAILFKNYDSLIILLLQLVFHGLWLVLAFNLSLSKLFYFGWFLAAINLAYQQVLISKREPVSYLKAFSINGYYGLIMWLALLGQLSN